MVANYFVRPLATYIINMQQSTEYHVTPYNYRIWSPYKINTHTSESHGQVK